MGLACCAQLNQSEQESQSQHEGFSWKWVQAANSQNRLPFRLEHGPILDSHLRYEKNQMTESLSLSCPYCGEVVELDIDESGGSRQAYVQDCPVCCRPWQVDVTRDREGSWNGTLRTTDE